MVFDRFFFQNLSSFFRRHLFLNVHQRNKIYELVLAHFFNFENSIHNSFYAIFVCFFFWNFFSYHEFDKNERTNKQIWVSICCSNCWRKYSIENGPREIIGLIISSIHFFFFCCCFCVCVFLLHELSSLHWCNCFFFAFEFFFYVLRICRNCFWW